MEQLEETKNKIEVLLDWVSNIGKEKEMEGIARENGNMPVEGKLTGRDLDDPNGNALDTTDNTSRWSDEETKELDIDQQYERLKVSGSAQLLKHKHHRIKFQGFSDFQRNKIHNIYTSFYRLTTRRSSPSSKT